MDTQSLRDPREKPERPFITMPIRTNDGKSEKRNGGGGGGGGGNGGGAAAAASGGRFAPTRRGVGDVAATIGVATADEQTPLYYLPSGEIRSIVEQLDQLRQYEDDTKASAAASSSAAAAEYAQFRQNVETQSKSKQLTTVLQSTSTRAPLQAVLAELKLKPPAPDIRRFSFAETKTLCAKQRVTWVFDGNSRRATPDSPLKIPIDGEAMLASVRSRLKADQRLYSEDVHMLLMSAKVVNFETNIHGAWLGQVVVVRPKTLSYYGELVASGTTPSEADAKIMDQLIKHYEKSDSEESEEKQLANFKAKYIAARSADSKAAPAKEWEIMQAWAEELKEKDRKREAKRKEDEAKATSGELSEKMYETFLFTPEAQSCFRQATNAYEAKGAYLSDVLIDDRSAALRRSGHLFSPLNPKVTGSAKLWSVIYRQISNHPQSSCLFAERVFLDICQRKGKQHFYEYNLATFEKMFSNDINRDFERWLIAHYVASKGSSKQKWEDLVVPLPYSADTNDTFTYHMFRHWIPDILLRYVKKKNGATLPAAEIDKAVWAQWQACIKDSNFVLEGGLKLALDYIHQIFHMFDRSRKVIPLGQPTRQAMTVCLTNPALKGNIEYGTPTSDGQLPYVMFEFVITGKCVSHDVYEQVYDDDVHQSKRMGAPAAAAAAASAPSAGGK